MDARASNKLTEGIEIAQQLAAGAAGACGAIDDRSHHARRDLLVETNAGAGQHARPNGVQPGQRHESDQERDREHQKRDLAGARNHAIIDLQHVERPGQIEQVNGQTEDRSGDEIALAALQQTPKFVRSLERSTHTVWRKPAPL